MLLLVAEGDEPTHDGELGARHDVPRHRVVLVRVQVVGERRERGLDERLLVLGRLAVEPPLEELLAVGREYPRGQLLQAARLGGEVGEHELLARAVLALALDEAEVEAHQLQRDVEREEEHHEEQAEDQHGRHQHGEHPLEARVAARVGRQPDGVRAEPEEEEGVVDDEQRRLERVEVRLRVRCARRLHHDENDDDDHGGGGLLARQLRAVLEADEDVDRVEQQLADHHGALPPVPLDLVPLVQVAVPPAKVQVVELVPTGGQLDEEEARDAQRVEQREEAGEDAQLRVRRRVAEAHYTELVRARPVGEAGLRVHAAGGRVVGAAGDLARADARKQDLLLVDERHRRVRLDAEGLVARVVVGALRLVLEDRVRLDAAEDFERALAAGHVVDGEHGHEGVEDGVLHRLELGARDRLRAEGEHRVEELAAQVLQLAGELVRQLLVRVDGLEQVRRLEPPPQLALDPDGEARLRHDERGELERKGDAAQHGHHHKGQHHHREPLLEVRDAERALGLHDLDVDDKEVEDVEHGQHLLRPHDRKVGKDGTHLQKVERDRDGCPVEAHLGRQHQQRADENASNDQQDDEKRVQIQRAHLARGALGEVQEGQTGVAPGGRPVVRPVSLHALHRFAKRRLPVLENGAPGDKARDRVRIGQRKVVEPPRLDPLEVVVVHGLYDDNALGAAHHRSICVLVPERPPLSVDPSPFELGLGDGALKREVVCEELVVSLLRVGHGHWNPRQATEHLPLVNLAERLREGDCL